MAAGDTIGWGVYGGQTHHGLYTSDSSSIFAACSNVAVYATRGVSWLSYTYTFQQMNGSNTSWITINTGSIGSSGSASVSRQRHEVNNSYRPRWRWYRSAGNGAATMRFTLWGRGRTGRKIVWSNQLVSAVGGAAPADNWQGNTGWVVLDSRKGNLADV